MRGNQVKGTKWYAEGDTTFSRYFGPIKAVIIRVWPHNTKQPTGYKCHLQLKNEFLGPRDTCELPIELLGVPWHDDKADAVACKMLESDVKKLIRSWLS